MSHCENNLAISLDVETLGTKHDAPIIQIGAALFDILDEPGTMIDSMEFLVSHGTLNNVEPYAAAMNYRILAALGGYEIDDPLPDQPTIHVDHTAQYLSSWITYHYRNNEKIVFCGKNFSGFDRPKLERLPDWEKWMPKYYHRSPDPGSMYWWPEVDGTELPPTQVCMERAGLEGIVAHTAEQDAIVVATLIQKWVQDEDVRR